RASSSRCVISSPASHTWPEVGTSRPASIASSVDLPAPDAPTSATVSAAAMRSDTSLTMVSSPSGLLTFRVSSLASRTILRSIRILLLALLSVVGVADAAAPKERTLLVFGDSLSAAYGLRTDEGWVTQL